jgi:DNA-binding transcriptional regulator YbjK
MPANPERRAQLLDAAIDIIADTGVGGLTHRLVDERAGLPVGTTSNYFRTRLALLEAATTHVAEQHWQRVAVLQAMVGQVRDPDGVKALMARMIADGDEASRRRNVARFELFLEGTRRPELQQALGEIQSAALKSAQLILEAAGLRPTPARLGELARMLNGVAFSNTTFTADQPGLEDPAGLIERLLKVALD